MKKFVLLSIVSLLSLASLAQETCPNDEIWYTSTDGQVVNPGSLSQFDATIVSNTYSGGKGVIKFNGNVTTIDRFAFYKCNSLSSITIPNSVKWLGVKAFADCTGLTCITIPNSVTTIGYYAFKNCSGLTSITIPNSVTRIGVQAFAGCTGLISVEIPISVTDIEMSAFNGCTGLTSIYVNWENPLSLRLDVFEEVLRNKCILYVPKGCENKYMKAEGWGLFKNIKGK